MNKKIDILKSKTRKILIILLCFILVFSGCAANPSEESEEPSEAPILGSENPSSDSEEEAPLRGASGSVEYPEYMGKIVDFYAENTLSQYLRYIDATIAGDGKTVFDLEYGYNIRDYTGDPHTFGYNNYYDYNRDGYDNYYIFIASSETDKISFYVPPFFGATAKNTIKYTVESNAEYLPREEGYYIIITTDIRVFVDAMYDAGHSDGNIYSSTITHILTITGSEETGLQIVCDEQIVDNGSDFDISGWSTFTTFGAMDHLTSVYDRLAAEMREIIESALKSNEDYAKEYEAFLNT